MWQITFVSTCTMALAVAGFWLGVTIHQLTWAVIASTLVGGAGGFGIGCASLDVLQRATAARPNLITTDTSV